VKRAPWLELNVITYQDMPGILLIAATKGNSCSSSGETVGDGCNGYSRQKSATACASLNYIATSNHIHLLVFDRGEREVIPRSMQLVAGRTGQQYNQRRNRKGAFWEDRYHATAVETNEHLIQCLVYMDLNMVRAGADVRMGSGHSKPLTFQDMAPENGLDFGLNCHFGQEK
jgi:Transposase IS200 like